MQETRRAPLLSATSRFDCIWIMIVYPNPYFLALEPVAFLAAVFLAAGALAGAAFLAATFLAGAAVAFLAGAALAAGAAAFFAGAVLAGAFFAVAMLDFHFVDVDETPATRRQGWLHACYWRRKHFPSKKELFSPCATALVAFSKHGIGLAVSGQCSRLGMRGWMGSERSESGVNR